jgi:hypothetical protein
VATVSGTTFATAGQGVKGTYIATAPGTDTVTIRYGAGYTAAGVVDNIFNCTGTQNTSVTPYDVFVNRFWVNNAVPTNPVLTCTYTRTSVPGTSIDVPLVNGVKSLSIFYGVKRNATNTGSCADTYLNAGQMATADWTEVCSVRISVTFLNPNIGMNIGPPTITVTRVVAVMNWAGINT